MGGQDVARAVAGGRLARLVAPAGGAGLGGGGGVPDPPPSQPAAPAELSPAVAALARMSRSGPGSGGAGSGSGTVYVGRPLAGAGTAGPAGGDEPEGQRWPWERPAGGRPVVRAPVAGSPVTTVPDEADAAVAPALGALPVAVSGPGTSAGPGDGSGSQEAPGATPGIETAAGVTTGPGAAAGVAADAGSGSGGLLGRLAGSAFDPGRAGLRALVVVAVVVLIGAGVLAWWSRPQPEPVVPRLATPVAVPATPTSPAELVVAVTGEVERPGLVSLPPGSRVADAIEAAGGILPGAEVDHLNLARKLTDGELIAVGVDPPPGEATGADPAVPGAVGQINLNTATAVELQALPGIGPALAQRIIDHRTRQGPFTSVDQLREVPGIGEVRFAELRDLVTV